MHAQQTLFAAVALAVLAAARPLPLNINLGAYSPALVVGDGEISIEQAAAAEGLIQSLQGAAVNGAGATAAAAAPAAPAPAPEPVPVQQGNPAEAQADATPLNGMGRKTLVLPRTPDESDDEHEHKARSEEEVSSSKVQKRQAGGGFDRALTYAEAALTKGPKIQLGTPESGVGIIIDNNQAAAARAGTGIAAE